MYKVDSTIFFFFLSEVVVGYRYMYGDGAIVFSEKHWVSLPNLSNPIALSSDVVTIYSERVKDF